MNAHAIPRRTPRGYLYVIVPGHPHADYRGRLHEHVLLAERALGRPLPERAQVHHVDGNKGNNAPGNLVLCQDYSYHALLHQRARALAACGNANWRKCSFCGEYDNPALMVPHSHRTDSNMQVCHRACRSDARRIHNAKKRRSA